MKNKIILLTTSCILLSGFLSSAAFAADQQQSNSQPNDKAASGSASTTKSAKPNQKAISQDVNKINTETAAIEKQMQTLQGELKQLKNEQVELAAYQQNQTTPNASNKKSNGSITQNSTTTNTSSQEQVQEPFSSTSNATPVVTSQTPPTTANGLPPQTAQQQYYSDLALKALKQSGYLGGSPVVTSPYLGVRSQYNGSDLIVNQSNVNTDLAILQQRQDLDDAAQSLGIPIPTHPRLSVSGEIEGQVTQLDPYSGGDSSDINLTDAELDMVAMVDPWVLGFMNFTYDSGSATPVNRVESSNVFLDRGFVTVGDLNKFPLYGTIGQIYVPFGQYNSFMVSDPMTKTLGRIKGRAVLFGYHGKSRDGLNASVFGFKGNTQKGGTITTGPTSIDQYGGNISYSFGDKLFDKDFNTNFGVSYIANIADSEGMQATGGNANGFFNGLPAFNGFGTTTPIIIGAPSSEALVHPVPAIDARDQTSLGPFTVIGEFVGSLRKFAPVNLSFNGRGAQPAALHVEGVYTTSIFTKSTSFAIGYGHTWESLGLNLPRNRFLATISMAVWKDTLASIEFRHSLNYSARDTANGGNLGPGSVFLTPGGTENLITGQLDMYF